VLGREVDDEAGVVVGHELRRRRALLHVAVVGLEDQVDQVGGAQQAGLDVGAERIGHGFPLKSSPWGRPHEAVAQ
jgi:hypothetical protein